MRTSRAIAVLDDEEKKLKAEHQTLIAKLAGIEDSLDRVKRMRATMEAVPKRTSKAKNRVAAAGNAAPATTSVAT